jgi:hypothetical protein
MEITLTVTVERYVRSLVESGTYTSPESAVNSLVAKIASDQEQAFPDRPLYEPYVVDDIPDFPRGKGTLITPTHSSDPRLPDLVGL